MKMTPEQKNKADRLNKVLSGGVVAILQMIDDLENKINQMNPNIGDIIKQIKGKDATPQEVADMLKNDREFLDALRAENGEDYVLTDEDKEQIATLTSHLIEPPEPVIERTVETVIREQPIIKNEIVKETTEVAIHESPIETRDKLESLEGKDRLNKSAIEGLDDYDEVARLARKKNKDGSIFTGYHGIEGINVNRITVSAVEPQNPAVNDLWVDIS